VLEQALAGGGYLCGDYSIADMCVWPWIEKYPDNGAIGGAIGGSGLAAHPGIAAWHARIRERPAVQRALQVGLDRLDPALTTIK
jgi:GSH-dependent disulfide-bond oxidoreductase